MPVKGAVNTNQCRKGETKMKRCQFNFNNEVDAFEILVDEETGRVEVRGEGEQLLAEYDSVQQMAEIYAQARDVKPENLKNWVLLQNGNVYSFVLRAGTAGVNVADVEEQLEAAIDGLAGKYHALSIARAKEQILADGMVDLTEALVHCTETDIARDIYDAMFPTGEAAEGTTEVALVEPEEVDTRSDLEKYVDDMENVPGAIGFLATLVGLGVGATKEEVLAQLTASYVLSNVSSLRALYNNAINDAITEGIGVVTAEDALTVITQTPAGRKDDTMKARILQATRMAGRNQMNVSVDIVGEKHIRHTAELVSLADLEGLDLYVRDNVPFVVRFSDTIDAEIEAERNNATVEEDDNEGYEDTYEDGYDDEDEDEYEEGEE